MMKVTQLLFVEVITIKMSSLHIIIGGAFPSLSLHQVYWAYNVISGVLGHVGDIKCHGEPGS